MYERASEAKIKSGLVIMLKGISAGTLNFFVFRLVVHVDVCTSFVSKGTFKTEDSL
jgi:hypothetical protein